MINYYVFNIQSNKMIDCFIYNDFAYCFLLSSDTFRYFLGNLTKILVQFIYLNDSSFFRVKFIEKALYFSLMQTWINIGHNIFKQLLVNLFDFDIFENSLKINISFLNAIFQSIEKLMALYMNILRTFTLSEQFCIHFFLFR